MRLRPPEAETVFCALGNRYYGNPLTNSGLNQLLKRIAKRAKVKEKVSPHRIRHMFAKEYLGKGSDLARLSKVMGHSSISTTAQHYAVYQTDDLQEQHEKFSRVGDL